MPNIFGSCCLLFFAVGFAFIADIGFKGCQTFVVPAMVLDSPCTIKPGYPLGCFVLTAHATRRMMAINFELGKKPTVGEEVDPFEFIQKGDYRCSARLWSPTSLNQLCSGQAYALVIAVHSYKYGTCDTTLRHAGCHLISWTPGMKILEVVIILAFDSRSRVLRRWEFSLPYRTVSRPVAPCLPVCQPTNLGPFKFVTEIKRTLNKGHAIQSCHCDHRRQEQLISRWGLHRILFQCKFQG